MTNFEGHLRLGIIASIGVAAGALYTGLSLDLAAIAVVLTLLGSIIPDIDIHSSIPRRWLGAMLLVVGPVVAIYFGVSNPGVSRFVGGFVAEITGIGRELIQPAGLLILAVGGLGAAQVMGFSIDEFLTHRGITHSLGFAVIGALVTGALLESSFPISNKLALAVGGCFGLGVVVHIYIGDS